MFVKRSFLLFALSVKVLLIAAVIGVAGVAAASRSQCNHLAYLSGINYDLLVMDSANQFYTNYSYFCSSEAPEQYACRCGHAEMCHKQLDPWGRNIGRCGCCSPGMLVELTLIVFILILLFVLVLYGYFGGRWLDNVWWFQGYPPPIFPVMARHGPYVRIPASEPLPHRLFRGYNTNDFVNEGAENEHVSNGESNDMAESIRTQDALERLLELWRLEREASVHPEEEPHPEQSEEQPHPEEEEEEQQQELSSLEQNIFSVEHTDEDERDDEQDEYNEANVQHTESDNTTFIPTLVHATDRNTNTVVSNTNHTEPNAPFERPKQLIHSDKNNNNNNNEFNVNSVHINSVNDDDDNDSTHRRESNLHTASTNNNNNNNSNIKIGNELSNSHLRNEITCVKNNFVNESSDKSNEGDSTSDSTSEQLSVDRINNVQKRSENDVESVENVESKNTSTSNPPKITLMHDESLKHTSHDHYTHHRHHRHHHRQREQQQQEQEQQHEHSSQSSNTKDTDKDQDDVNNNDNNSNSKEDANNNHVRSTSFVTVGRSNTSSVASSYVGSQSGEEYIVDLANQK